MKTLLTNLGEDVRPAWDGDEADRLVRTVTATRTYDAFGMPVSSSGTPQGPFGFAATSGYQEDGDTGLKLLGHRYYDPSTGRFLTRDPAQDGRNWYAYCGNNPQRRVDPTGRVFWVPIIIAVVVVVLLVKGLNDHLKQAEADRQEKKRRQEDPTLIEQDPDTAYRPSQPAIQDAGNRVGQEIIGNEIEGPIGGVGGAPGHAVTVIDWIKETWDRFFN